MNYNDLIYTAKCCDIKDCDDCPSKGRTCCRERAMHELATALKKEKSRAEIAEARAEKADRERDVAVKDIDILAEHFYFEANGKNPCIICDNQKKDCTFCDGTLGFRWRGVKEE